MESAFAWSGGSLCSLSFVLRLLDPLVEPSSLSLDITVGHVYFVTLQHEQWQNKEPFPSISYYFHIPKIFLIFFPHTGKNRNRRKSNLLP